MVRAQQAQAAHTDGTGGGTVAVVVGHDTEAFVGRNGVGQQHGGLVCALHAGGRQQAGQAVVEFVLGHNTPGRVQAGQQWV